MLRFEEVLARVLMLDTGITGINGPSGDFLEFTQCRY
jgi:hypothetical protein